VEKKEDDYFERKFTPSAKKYGYNILDRNEVLKPIDGKGKPEQALFETEELALIHKKGFRIKQDYDQLDKTGELDHHALKLQEEIKKKQSDFIRIKASFIKEPFFSIS